MQIPYANSNVCAKHENSDTLGIIKMAVLITRTRQISKWCSFVIQERKCRLLHQLTVQLTNSIWLRQLHSSIINTDLHCARAPVTQAVHWCKIKMHHKLVNQHFCQDKNNNFAVQCTLAWRQGLQYFLLQCLWIASLNFLVQSSIISADHQTKILLHLTTEIKQWN